MEIEGAGKPMKLTFVNIMQELQRFDSTAYITQPPVPLAILNAATPKIIETALIDEQTDHVRFAGDVFAFSVSTQNDAISHVLRVGHRGGWVEVCGGDLIRPSAITRQARMLLRQVRERWREVSVPQP